MLGSLLKKVGLLCLRRLNEEFFIFRILGVLLLGKVDQGLIFGTRRLCRFRPQRSSPDLKGKLNGDLACV